MPEETRYAVECKNQDCKALIIFGHYLVSAKAAGDSAAAASITPAGSSVRCVSMRPTIRMRT